MSVAESITRRTFKKGFLTFSKKTGKKPTELEFVIKAGPIQFHENGTSPRIEIFRPVYRLYFSGKPSQINPDKTSTITMADMIDMDFDMMNRDEMANQYLPQIMSVYAAKHQVSAGQLTFVVRTLTDEDVNPFVELYVSNEFKEQLTIAQITGVTE